MLFPMFRFSGGAFPVASLWGEGLQRVLGMKDTSVEKPLSRCGAGWPAGDPEPWIAGGGIVGK